MLKTALVQQVLERVAQVLERVAQVLEQVTVNGIEIPEHGSGSELFFFSIEQQ